MQDFGFLIPIVMVGVFGVIALFVFFIKRQQDAERTRQLQVTAAQLRWTFVEEAALSTFPGIERFEFFTRGRFQKIKNLMYGEASGIKAVVFDFTYVLGYGRNRRTCAQTMVYLEPGNIILPYFSLRTERFAHKLWAAFGYQDIDIANRPGFNSQYLLRGPDEQAIRNIFSDGLLSFYETYPGTCTDGGGNQLFVYRENYRWEPEQIQPFIGTALAVLNLLPRNGDGQKRAEARPSGRARSI